MKRALRWIGWAIAIAAGIFFLRDAYQAFTSMGAITLSRGRLWAAVAVMVPAYCAAVPIAAHIWRRLLASMGVALSATQAYAIVAFTQFGKYVPGNVAHHIGRVAVARTFGGDGVRLSLSLVYENLLGVLAAAHLTAAFLVWNPVAALEQWLPPQSRPWLLLIVTLGAGAAFLLLPRAVAWIQSKRGSGANVARCASPSIRAVLGCYLMALASLLVVGLGFTAMAAIIEPGAGFPFFAMAGGFAAAWIIGLLAPGAPAGLGIREAVLLILLGDVMAATDAVVVIALLRIATTLGDLIHFIIGGGALRRVRTHRIPSDV